MTLTLQQAKDEVYGKHFDKNGRMWLPTTFEYNKMDDEAAELYAEAKAKEAFEAAHEVIDEDITIPSEVWKYKNYEHFKNSK